MEQQARRRIWKESEILKGGRGLLMLRTGSLRDERSGIQLSGRLLENVQQMRSCSNPPGSFRSFCVVGLIASDLYCLVIRDLDA